MEDTVTTNVIKRNGEEVHFDREKIVNAITKANGNVERIHQMNPYQIEAIADTIAEQVQETLPSPRRLGRGCAMATDPMCDRPPPTVTVRPSSSAAARASSVMPSRDTR